MSPFSADSTVGGDPTARVNDGVGCEGRATCPSCPACRWPPWPCRRRCRSCRRTCPWSACFGGGGRLVDGALHLVAVLIGEVAGHLGGLGGGLLQRVHESHGCLCRRYRGSYPSSVPSDTSSTNPHRSAIPASMAAPVSASQFAWRRADTPTDVDVPPEPGTSPMATSGEAEGRSRRRDHPCREGGQLDPRTDTSAVHFDGEAVAQLGARPGWAAGSIGSGGPAPGRGSCRTRPGRPHCRTERPSPRSVTGPSSRAVARRASTRASRRLTSSAL